MKKQPTQGSWNLTAYLLQSSVMICGELSFLVEGCSLRVLSLALFIYVDGGRIEFCCTSMPLLQFVSQRHHHFGNVWLH